jgi:exoribonuclease R
MLPAILSDTLCSLQENQSRFALAMDILVDASGNRIKTPTFRNVLIQVSKNFVYEEPLLLMNESYNVLLRTVKKMDPTINNSHDVVAYFMVLYNTECATLLEKNQKGIFRATTLLRPDEFQKTQNDTQHLSSDTKRLVYHWNHSFAEYIPFCENNRKDSKILQHNYTYTHMTSPIRRLVDIINQMIFSQISHPENRVLVTRFSEKANTFITKTIQNIEYINQSMRSIRKVQIHCHLMNQCLLDPLIMKREHDGVVFHKELKKNKENMFSYMVYVEEYKLLAHIVTDADLPNYSKHSFKIFLFEDENKIMKKIKFELVRKMYTPENPSLNHLA